MSIFSKLFKGGPEDGGPEPDRSEKPAAARPAPAAREPAAGPPHAARPASNGVAANGAPAHGPSSNKERDGSAQAAVKAATTTRAYAAPAPRPATANNKAAPAPTARPTPARVAAPAPTARPAAGPPSTRAANSAAVPRAKTAPEPSESIEIEALPATGSIDQAFDQLLGSVPVAPVPAAPPNGAGVSTESDLRAVMATFEDLAVGHSAEVRSLMMEVRWGEAQTSWLELARPALKSLRAMAGQVGHDPLAAALDGFGAALDEAVRPGAPPTVGAATRDKLLAAYAPLVAALPAAFELQGERDRREPVVVRALLAQVQGLEPLMIDKLMAAGLTRLEALFQARADEVAAVSGLPADVAAAIVARVQDWRRATPAALATPDRAATARELGALIEALEAQQTSFEDASRGWSERDREAKRRLRRERDLSFSQITIVLARLGEVELALALDRQSFARRLEELGRLMTRLPRAAAPAAPEGQARKMEREVQSGAHAAP